MRPDERLAVIFETAAGIVTRTPAAWVDYLTFAARIYKYPFDNALLIYAQDPTATMLATREIWQRVGRELLPKAKSIAVCEYKNARNTLKYLFDASQTLGNVLPTQWKINEEMCAPVALELSKRYNVDISDLQKVVDGLVTDVSIQNMERYLKDLDLDVHGHFFSEVPREGLEQQICDAVITSAQIFVSSRCGLPLREEKIQELTTIPHFDTVSLVCRLGSIVTDMAKTALLDMEYTIKNMERRQHHAAEQIEPGIYRERWPVIPEHRTGERAPGNRQIWASVDGQHAEEPPLPVHLPADDRGSGADSPESGPRGNRTARDAVSAIVDSKPITADRGHTEESPPSEQPAAVSRGSSDEGNRSDTPIKRAIESTGEIDPINEEEPQGSFSFEEDLAVIPSGNQINLFETDNNAESDSTDTPDASFTNFTTVSAPSVSERTEPLDNGEPTHSTRPQSSLVAMSRPMVQPKRMNYRFSETDNLYPPGPKTKYQNNMEAIKLLKRVEGENRLATAAEQRVLARYVGWGGLANAFDPKSAEWAKEYAELKLLLDEKEYDSAKESVLTAYYTDQRLVQCFYQALKRFGLADGTGRRILDPAMGTGNFYSALPDNLSNATLVGVEIDDITGRLARQLYQTADIQLSGFETSGINNGSVDVAIGNIPFNNFKIYDPRYSNDWLIHDYFFIRTLDVLKPGGIAAYITSKGTMDKQNTDAREEMARRADLIGAIRLPNNMFKAIAGTEVTTDILFFQRLHRERKFDRLSSPDWVYTTYRKPDYIRMNQYYIDHPDMILGDMQKVSGHYGFQEECVAPEDQEIYLLLEQAIGKLGGELLSIPDEVKPQNTEVAHSELENLKAPEGIKPYTYHVQDTQLYYCSGGILIPQDFSGKRLDRIVGLCGIREALRKVIDLQANDFEETDLVATQKTLNERYDTFVKSNGFINAYSNVLAFSDDDTFPLLRSIEDYEKQTDTWRKAPVFSRATIRHQRFPNEVESALQALQICLNVRQRVDISFMTQLYGRSPDEIITELGDRIYLNPQKYYGNPHDGWELDEEYLSGYVCDKLAYALLKAEDTPELFSRNVDALRTVQPIPLLPGEIEYNIGSPWIPIQYYTQFMYETFGTYERNKGTGRSNITIEYLTYTNSWHISNKTNEYGNVKVNQTYGSDRIDAYSILENCLNLQSVTIRDSVRYTDENGNEKTKYVINAKQTTIARSKQQLIRDAFKSWLFVEPKRSEALMKLYNEKFNNLVPRVYDGSHLVFPGMSDELEFRPHQLNVAARIIYNGTALMGHEVGAGKTAAMIAAGMYMKHYGLVSKPTYIVPNHIIDQWSNEFLRFFPGANLLVTSEKDFQKKNRQQFVSKIAMGSYDAIIISHSQFEKIAISRERQEKLLHKQINHLTSVLDKMKSENGDKWSVKQVAIFQKQLKSRLERLLNAEKKDDLISFEELGIDYMFVDEAHQYKNNFTYTKIRNVAGIGTSSSQRAADMKMKCEYLQENYNGRGVTFATGTPITNSISELYIMQNYLQSGELKRRGLDFFDNWAATYAQLVTGLEITPEGGGYRVRSRFSKFQNMPELMNLFSMVADIQTEDMLGLPTPEIEGGKAQMVETMCSSFQKERLMEFVERSEAIRNRQVPPESDNMLKLTHEAKLLAIDPRLLYPDAPNHPDSKLNVCIRNIFSIWEETKEKKLTQLMFCDSGTPKPDEFNVYHETRSELVRKGIPEEEIAFIHDCKTDTQREVLFEKVRAGDVRILLGSTQKLGMGTNVQDKLFAVHHTDVPWRPADITQRNGRAKRQGNQNPTIRIFQYVTKGSFDSYLWQIQEQKLRFITQVMTGKAITRSCEDVDISVLSAAEFKAIATDNPMVLEKMTAENEVTRLTILRNSWQNERSTLSRNIEYTYPGKIANCERNIKAIDEDITTVKANRHNGFHIELNGRQYTERSKAGGCLELVIDMYQSERMLNRATEHSRIGSIHGLDIFINADNQFETSTLNLSIKGRGDYAVYAGDSGIGNITRLENLIDSLEEKRKDFELKKSEIQEQLTTAIQELDKPFPHESELAEYSQKLIRINTALEFKEQDGQDDLFDGETTGDDGDRDIPVGQPEIAQ